MMRLLSTAFNPDTFAFDLVEVSPTYDVSDVNSYNGGITSMLANRLIVELLAGLSLTKKGEREGHPVRPKKYRGLGHTYQFSMPNGTAKVSSSTNTEISKAVLIFTAIVMVNMPTTTQNASLKTGRMIEEIELPRG